MTTLELVLLGALTFSTTVAIGLYLQLRDALLLAKTWRELAVDAFTDATRERHLAEFAVRQLEPRGPLGELDPKRPRPKRIRARRIVEDDGA